MKKIIVSLFLVVLMAIPSLALTSAYIDNTGDVLVEKEQGYYVGMFYKYEADGKTYKVVSVTDDEIRLGYFESGELAVMPFNLSNLANR